MSIQNATNKAQQLFDDTYITAKEIADRLGVNRATVADARARGYLCDPIVVNKGAFYLWERASVESYLQAWETMLKTRRGQA